MQSNREMMLKENFKEYMRRSIKNCKIALTVFKHHGACENCTHKLCCKVNAPVFFENEIIPIARYLKMKYDDFIKEYLVEYEAEFIPGLKQINFVINDLPCPFLNSEDKCIIYPVRPKTCRTYPFESSQHLILGGVELCQTSTYISSEFWEFENEKNKNVSDEVIKQARKKAIVEHDRIYKDEEKLENLEEPYDKIMKKLGLEEIVEQEYRDFYPYHLFQEFSNKKLKLKNVKFIKMF